VNDRCSDDWRENGPIDEDRRDDRDWDAEYERDRDRATEARLDREREKRMLDESPPVVGGEDEPW